MKTSIPFMELKNIGEKTAQWIHDAGIHSVEELSELGAVEAWTRIKAVHPELTLVGLYALQGALLELHWKELPPEMKAELRALIWGEMKMYSAPGSKPSANLKFETSEEVD